MMKKQDARQTVTKEVRGFVYSKRILTENNSARAALPLAKAPVKPTPTRSTPKRRSSVGLRGKRVGSNGLCPPPHPSIATNEYYTFIDANLSDPMRMRQLLYWLCLKTADLSNPAHKSIINSLVDRSLNTSWYLRAEKKEVKELHPNNTANAKKVIELEEKLKEYQNEIDWWNKSGLVDTVRAPVSMPSSLSVDTMEVLSKVQKTCGFVDDHLSSPSTIVKGFLWEQQLHQAWIISQDIIRSFEHIYAKMMTASVQRDMKTQQNAFDVLGLLSKTL